MDTREDVQRAILQQYDALDTTNTEDDLESLTLMMQGFTIAKIKTNSETQSAVASLETAEKTKYNARLDVEIDNLIIKLQHNISINPSNISAEIMAELLLPILAYEHCLNIDIKKWQSYIQKTGKPIPIMPVIDMSKFVPQEQRIFPDATTVKMHVKKDEFTMLQLPFNYWRSCYKNLPIVEKSRGIPRYTYEKEMWRLEQLTLFYKKAYDNISVSDLNQCRIPEPHNAYGFEPKPLDYKMLRSQSTRFKI